MFKVKKIIRISIDVSYTSCTKLTKEFSRVKVYNIGTILFFNNIPFPEIFLTPQQIIGEAREWAEEIIAETLVPLSQFTDDYKEVCKELKVYKYMSSTLVIVYKLNTLVWVFNLNQRLDTQTNISYTKVPIYSIIYESHP